MARNKYRELTPKRKWRKRLGFIKTGTGCLFLLFLLIGAPGGLITYSLVRSHYLRTAGIVTKGIVIDEKNYFGNQPITQGFSYSYRFVVNGKEYTGDSRSRRYSVGQGILIKYAANYPRFNEAYEPE